MITDIAYELVKEIVSNSSFIDRWTGVVIPMKKSVNGTEKVFPVAHNTPSTCDLSDYTSLVPDSDKAGICYCEVVSQPVFEPLYSTVRLVNASLRVVLWYNLDRVNAGFHTDESVLLGNVMQWIPRSLPDYLFTSVKNVNIYIDNVSSGVDLFSKYSYDEVRTQFVTHPYGAVAIDLSIQYTSTNCATQIIPTLKCGLQ